MLSSDGAGPTLLNVSYNYNNKQLKLVFDENVSYVNDRFAFYAWYLIGEPGRDNLTFSAFDSNTSATNGGVANLSIMTISDVDRDNISRWQVSFNLTIMNISLIKDLNGNNIMGQQGGVTYPNTFGVASYARDTTVPTLVNWSYNHNDRNITFGFSEIIPTPSRPLK